MYVCLIRTRSCWADTILPVVSKEPSCSSLLVRESECVPTAKRTARGLSWNEEQSTGQRNRIQVSQQTANLLINAGKANWITARSDLVEAK